MVRRRQYEDYFIYKDDGSAECRTGGCSHPTMPRKQTNGMQKHLKVHHPALYAQMLEQKVASGVKAECKTEDSPQDVGNADDDGQTSTAGENIEPEVLAVVILLFKYYAF